MLRCAVLDACCFCFCAILCGAVPCCNVMCCAAFVLRGTPKIPKVKVSKDYIRKRPAVLSVEAAAAMPSVTFTAYYAAVRLVGPLRPGSTVLVHSAAGGVGSMLVQICKLKGWRVCGVVGRGHKVEACKALGADCVIDKSSTSLWGAAEAFAPDGYDAIFDANGVATFKDSWNHLTPGGKLIVYGFHTMLPKQGGVLGLFEYISLAYNFLRTPSFSPMEMVSDNKSVMGFNLSFLFKRRDLFDPMMDDVLRWIDEGKIVLPMITTYPLADVRHAHAALESGLTVGKLVLLPP